MAVQSNDKLGYQETNGTAIWNLAFNVNVEPFDDVKVRKALAMAVKRDDIIAGAMDGAGMPAEIILTDQTAPIRERTPLTRPSMTWKAPGAFGRGWISGRI